jgi:hypothetical protein
MLTVSSLKVLDFVFLLCLMQILEGPYYGKRKPPQQKGSKLRR